MASGLYKALSPVYTVEDTSNMGEPHKLFRHRGRKTDDKENSVG